MKLKSKRLMIAVLAATVLLTAEVSVGSARADDHNDHHNDHDWHKGREWNDNHRDQDGQDQDDRDGDNGHHDNDHRADPRRVFYYPSRYYRPQTRIVYLAPQTTYYNGPYYSQVFASDYVPSNSVVTQTYYYPNGYVQTYTVGGYLPRNRHWQPLRNYVRYGLPAPRRGEKWVYDNRDAVLISEATSRIISGIVLAANID